MRLKVVESLTQEVAIKHLIDIYKSTNFSYLGSSYILPDGTILDLGTDGYGHASVSAWLEENGLEIDFEPGTDSKLLRSLGWIRANGRWNFVTLPPRAVGITDSQYEKLADLFDSWRGCKYGIQVTTGDQDDKVIYRSSSPAEIIQSIQRYYKFGRLREQKD